MSHARTTRRPSRTAGMIAALRDSFRGRLIGPTDGDYDSARAMWNGAVARYPALIARCTDAADVAVALRVGIDHQLPIAVRGGGHNVAGTAGCDDGLVLDLSPMKSVRVDPADRTAHAQPGLLWGEFDAATQAHGLATTGGIVTHTGIAGLTLGGGLGWLMRTYGLTCDNLLGAELVDADGRLRTADACTDPELLWALRGGGGNFGVVTDFHYQLHPIGRTVLAGPLLYPAARAREVLDCYRDVAGHAPDELGSVVTLRHVPPLPLFPPEMHGEPVVSIVVCWIGDPSAGQRVLAPLRQEVAPLTDLVALRPYLAHQGTFDATVPHGLHYYWKSEYLSALEDEAVTVLLDHAWNSHSRYSYTIIFHLGGAVARTDPVTAAFTGRHAGFAVNINAVALDAADYATQSAWVREFWQALRPRSTGVYVNFLGDEGPDRVRAAYGEQTYARLARIKSRLDPGNVFRLNQNITPSVAPEPLSRAGG